MILVNDFKVGTIIDTLHTYSNNKTQRHRAIFIDVKDEVCSILMLTDNAKSARKICRVTPTSKVGKALGAYKNSYLVEEKIRAHKVKFISEPNEYVLDIVEGYLNDGKKLYLYSLL